MKKIVISRQNAKKGIYTTIELAVAEEVQISDNRLRIITRTE